MRVFVYWNLHKGMWSVKAMEGAHKGKVIARVGELALSNATFKVSRAGRERVLREQCKNVHAGVVGDLTDSRDVHGTVRVTYNPYKYSTFVKADAPDEPIRDAAQVKFYSDRSVYI
jgi:hypothetical protein